VAALSRVPRVGTARLRADGPQQLAGDGLDEVDRRPVEVVFAQRLAGYPLKLRRVDLVRQTDRKHPHPGVLRRQRLHRRRLHAAGIALYCKR